MCCLATWVPAEREEQKTKLKEKKENKEIVRREGKRKGQKNREKKESEGREAGSEGEGKQESERGKGERVRSVCVCEDNLLVQSVSQQH